MISDRTLRRWYREYNAKYFGGELDDDVDVVFGKIKDHAHVEGETTCVSFDICVTYEYQDDVQRARKYLLHEMVHGRAVAAHLP